MQTNTTILNSSTSSKQLNIIIAGGGTGGHIFPAVAIANALRKQLPNIKILFVGALGKMEMEKVPEAGYDIVGLPIAGYNRESIFKNISLPFKILKSFLKVRQIISAFKPDAVVGVGGYSTFPILRYAQTISIPTFIHEANSYAGKSNLILAKRATKIFVATESMNQFFPFSNLVVTGNPVREVFSKNNILRKEGLEFFGLKPELKTIFVMGGSLGAKSINETIENNLSFFKSNNLQLIWQTGKNYATKAALAEEHNSNVWSNAFINKMEYAYAAADIVVSRSGAMAISELCVVGKPVIFVPYPHAAEDHQVANALNLVNKKAALIVKDGDVNTMLVPTIKELIDDNELCLSLREHISKLGNVNADDIIANEILECIQ